MHKRKTARDEASEYLRLALPFMARYRIPVTPENYAVWYEYVSRTNEPLREALDDLLRGEAGVDEEQTHQLYQRYVVDEMQKKLSRARDALRVLLEELGGEVSHAGENVERYEQSLAGYSRRLEESINAADLRNVITNLASETRSVREMGLELQDRLEDSRKEAEALRKELEQIRHEATTDPLTGLANRKAFYRALEHMTRPSDNDDVVCLILCDIDDFKSINDTYGHLLGDKVIRFIGTILKDCVKGKDLVARYGGEEFAVLLPDTPFTGAVTVAESIRSAVEGGKLVRSDTRQAIGKITLSAGVAQYRDAESFDEFIGRADEALYRSKNAGKNKVTGETGCVVVAV